MLHPHTELRFVSPEIGYGIYATEDIPKGTITWVKDELDRVFTPSEVAMLTPANHENLLKYTYRNREGNYFFCWDLTRFVNHSFEANSMLTSQNFEIAIVDIKKGDEITNDYGTLNILESFKCANGPYKNRKDVNPDDLIHYYKVWDKLIESAMLKVKDVKQPLSHFLSPEQKTNLEKITLGQMPLPSILENYYKPL